jgi:hypothetical protein
MISLIIAGGVIIFSMGFAAGAVWAGGPQSQRLDEQCKLTRKYVELAYNRGREVETRNRQIGQLKRHRRDLA